MPTTCSKKGLWASATCSTPLLVRPTELKCNDAFLNRSDAACACEACVYRRCWPGHEPVPGAEDGQSAAVGRRAGRRQNRDRQGVKPGVQHTADPAAMLRGHRHQPGGLRMEL